MRQQTPLKQTIKFNGFIAVMIAIVSMGVFFYALPFYPLLSAFSIPVGILALLGLRLVQPNNALVATSFGRYVGVVMASGFYWVWPWYFTKKVSLRTANYVTPVLKVNDLAGNPIEIAAAVVYHIANPAAALLDIEDVDLFMRVQCESALRTIASHHAYSAADTEGECLSRHSDTILQQFEMMVQERVEMAGISVNEVRFTHLAYASEIAHAMLRRQQADAVVAARAKLVQGAIEMVEDAVAQLTERHIVALNESDKAKLITNMMTVLLSEEAATPVLNVSGHGAG